MALSCTNIVKVIVVTDDLEKTSNAYKKLIGTGTPPSEENEIKQVRTLFTEYKGKPIKDVPMKVKSVFSDNFWFEIIQPLGVHDPWSQWLKRHGTSICSICLLTGGTLEADAELMKNAGYESIFRQEKDCESYEYFDASEDMGVLVEIKERY